jgi:hypothetical protein
MAASSRRPSSLPAISSTTGISRSTFQARSRSAMWRISCSTFTARRSRTRARIAPSLGRSRSSIAILLTFCRLRKSPTSRPETRESATPAFPTLQVRPVRCT